MNKEEAKSLTKKKGINHLLKKLISYGPDLVVITNGKKGAYAYDGKLKYFVATNSVKIKETTGAGDAFASTFVAAIHKKNDIKLALQTAQANAESVITHYGAKNKLLSWNALLKSSNRKIKETKI